MGMKHRQPEWAMGEDQVRESALRKNRGKRLKHRFPISGRLI
jgi:hypothetical protein